MRDRDENWGTDASRRGSPEMHGLGRHRPGLDPRRRRACLDRAGAAAAERRGPRAFTFVQISDSHIGFNKPANPDARATFREAVAKINALPVKPDFIIHTGDLTQLSQGQTSSTTPTRSSRTAGVPVFYVPGEHDMLDDNGKAFLARFGKGTKGARLVQLRPQRRALHRPGQCAEPEGRRAWAASAPSSSPGWSRTWPALAVDRRSWSSPTSRSGRSIPTGAGAPTTARRRWRCSKRFGSVTVLNGHIHQVQQKVEGNIAFHTARSTAFPQPAPGTPGASPGPMKVAGRQAAQRARRAVGERARRNPAAGRRRPHPRKPDQEIRPCQPSCQPPCIPPA